MCNKQYENGINLGKSDAEKGLLRRWTLWFNRYYMDHEGNTKSLNDPFVKGYFKGYFGNGE